MAGIFPNVLAKKNIEKLIFPTAARNVTNPEGVKGNKRRPITREKASFPVVDKSLSSLG